MDSLCQREEGGVVYYSALEAVINVFACVRHEQTELEASNKPTMVNVITKLEEMKKNMCLSSGLCNSETFEPPSEHTQILAKNTLDILNEVHYHNFWCTD